MIKIDDELLESIVQCTVSKKFQNYQIEKGTEIYTQEILLKLTKTLL